MSFSQLDPRPCEAVSISSNRFEPRPMHRIMKSARLVPLTCAALVLVASVAHAQQVSPVGADDTTVGPGTGVLSPVSATGGYQTVAPIELPKSRGRFTIPFAVRYVGGPSTGAAGVGWDVPLSFVRRSDTWWRRKPVSYVPDFVIPERIVLSLGGQSFYMVPGNEPRLYVPFAADRYMELREDGNQGAGWTLSTADGVEYRFDAVDTVGDGTYADEDFWVLTRIDDRVGGDHAELVYLTSDPCPGLDTPARPELDLDTISYGFSVASNTSPSKPLYEIAFKYEFALDGSCDVIGNSVANGDLLPRSRRLSRVAVFARDNTDPNTLSSTKAIQTYELGYEPDRDTAAPRLTSVSLRGEDEMTGDPVTLARYEYGATARTDGGIEYAPSAVVPIDVDAVLAGFDALASSEISGEHEFILDNQAWKEVVRTRSAFRDFTGDGVPDLLWKSGSTWHLRSGVVTDDGPRFDTGNTSTWTEPAEIYVQETRGYSDLSEAWRRRALVTTEVTTKFIDWNGDGRTDVVEAGGGGDLSHWRVWLNQRTVSGGVWWLPVRVGVQPLLDHIDAAGLDLDFLDQGTPTRVAIERSRSWARAWSVECTFLDEAGPGGPCATPAAGSQEADTQQEWSILDGNGDSYPDIVIRGEPVIECESVCESNDPQWDPETCTVGCIAGEIGSPNQCWKRRWEWLGTPSDEDCDPFTRETRSPVSILINTDGALPGAFDVAFADPREFSRETVLREWTSATGPGFPSLGGPAGDTFSDGLTEEHGLGVYEARGYERYDSNRDLVCRLGFAGDLRSTQLEGLADLNGDGSPDHVYRDDNGVDWYVELGSTSGFGTPRLITSELAFAISETVGDCFGNSHAVAGLIDLDADGKPEMVRFEDGELRAATILTSEGIPGGLEPGRLTRVYNSYGAYTEIRYANNKAERNTPHEVPAPEVVVGETQVIVPDGSAPDGVPVRYAYGTVERRYDPVFNRTSFAGYRRQVILLGQPRSAGGTDIEGTATIIDHVPQSSAGAGFAAFVQGGRVASISRLEGVFMDDPRALLTAPDTDFRVRGRESRTYRVVELSPPVPPVGLPECFDIDLADVFPVANDLLCRRNGVVYQAITFVWQGTQAPTSDRNVATYREIDEVDERGRPLHVIDQGDFSTHMDDTCTTIEYATPTSATARAFTATTGVWTSDCGWTRVAAGSVTPGPEILLAGIRFLYDDQAEGFVGRGRVQQQILENYNTTDGSSLGENVASTLQYNALGEVQMVTATRTLGSAATRTTTFAYDAYGATATSVTESASDVSAAPFVKTQRLSTWASLDAEEIALNGERTVTKRDRFGRPIQTDIIASGVTHTLATVDYRFDGRVVTETSYPSTSTLPQVSRLYLDALGRTRFRQLKLGADYAGSSLVVGYTDFDEYGRPRYTAAPFEWATDFMPGDLPQDRASWPFGTTAVYDRGGRVVRTVEARGVQTAPTSTSVATDTFVSRYEYAWSGNKAIVRTWDSGQTDPASATTGSYDEQLSTALGWVTETTRRNASGTRLDLVRYGVDHLGNETRVWRYKTPSTESGLVTWARTFDSLGRPLTSIEPGMGLQTTRYDEWSNVIETELLEGTAKRLTQSGYDGFGRATRFDILRKVGSSQTTEWKERFYYDTHSGSSLQPTGDFRGRLSRVQAVDIGDVYYGYDSLGRPNSETYWFTAHGKMERATRSFAPGGALQEIGFETPAGTDRIQYVLDSAARTKQIIDTATNLKLFDAAIDPKGRYLTVKLGNGVTEGFSFAPDGREELNFMSANAPTWARSYALASRDGAGRVLVESFQVSTTAGVNVTNTYDVMGRLKKSVRTGAGTVGAQNEVFAYDPLGNITSKGNLNVPSQDRTYGYDTTDPDRLRCFSGTTGGCGSGYDTAGSLIFDDWTGSQRNFSYDAAGRIVSVMKGASSASFLYGPGGDVIKTDVVGSGINRTIWSFGGLIEERRRPDGKVQTERRIPGPLGIVATFRTEGTNRETIYVHGDPRGNRFFSRSNGTLAQELRYRVFGGILQDTGTASSITYSDDLWNAGDDFRELGIARLGARLYDPAVGRFLQRDPIMFPGSASQRNPYAFAFNDPVNYSDPSGLCPDDVDACIGRTADVDVVDVSIGLDFGLGGSGVTVSIATSVGGDVPTPTIPTSGLLQVGLVESYVDQQQNQLRGFYRVVKGSIVTAYRQAKCIDENLVGCDQSVQGVLGDYAGKAQFFRDVDKYGLETTVNARVKAHGGWSQMLGELNAEIFMAVATDGAVRGSMRVFGRAVEFGPSPAPAIASESLISDGGYVKGYRAVSAAERADIAEHGFRPDPAGRSMEDKWFSESPEGAEWFRKNLAGLDEIVEALVPRDVYERSFRDNNIDRTGPGFCVACSDLPLVKPVLR